MTINDFLLIKSLASGAYGKVILSRKKNTKDMFAIKVLEIAKMKEKNCQEQSKENAGGLVHNARMWWHDL